MPNPAYSRELLKVAHELSQLATRCARLYADWKDCDRAIGLLHVMSGKYMQASVSHERIDIPEYIQFLLGHTFLRLEKRGKGIKVAELLKPEHLTPESSSVQDWLNMAYGSDIIGCDDSLPEWGWTSGAVKPKRTLFNPTGVQAHLTR